MGKREGNFGWQPWRAGELVAQYGAELRTLGDALYRCSIYLEPDDADKLMDVMVPIIRDTIMRALAVLEVSEQPLGLNN